MGMLLSGVGALSTFYPDAKQIDDPEERYMAAIRLIAKVPTLAAFAYRHNMGLPYVYPDNDLSYSENFLSMMFKKTEVKYEPDPRLAKALDVLFILHADHEQNCSTSAVRGVGSSQVDPYSAVAAGVAALYGPLHGGANEAVLRMLRRIETVENIPDFLEGVKSREEKLMGFGHRVYKNYDPRARIIKKHVDEVLEATEYNPLIEIATELEKRALDDEFFTSRKLYPNVDFYSGLIYEALEIPTEMFTVIFAIPRTSGWVAQWMEMNDDPSRRSPARARSTPATSTATTSRSPTARGPRRSPGRPHGAPSASAAGRRRQSFPPAPARTPGPPAPHRAAALSWWGRPAAARNPRGGGPPPTGPLWFGSPRLGRPAAPPGPRGPRPRSRPTPRRRRPRILTRSFAAPPPTPPPRLVPGRRPRKSPPPPPRCGRGPPPRPPGMPAIVEYSTASVPLKRKMAPPPSGPAVTRLPVSVELMIVIRPPMFTPRLRSLLCFPATRLRSMVTRSVLFEKTPAPCRAMLSRTVDRVMVPGPTNAIPPPTASLAAPFFFATLPAMSVRSMLALSPLPRPS